MKFYRHLYFYVILGIIAGILVGIFFPQTGIKMKFLAELFIRLIKILISPIIFFTVVAGIAGMENLKKVGRLGLKAFIYFEIVTTLALLIGLVVANLFQPGKGMNIDPNSINQSVIPQTSPKSKDISFLDKIIPTDIISPFANGEILQILFLAILTGFAISMLNDKSGNIKKGLDTITEILFKILSIFMKTAPLGAFGAMAYTVGEFGSGTIISLGKLMACVYLTCILFVFVVLGIIAYLHKISLRKFLYFIKEEIFLVLGTSSSESALPSMMKKMQQAGCSQPSVSLIIPAGYSFNLDGTSIYLTMAALFIAQAMNINLSLDQQLLLIGVLMITSKGAAAITGGGLITLAATLGSLEMIPVAGVALIIGVDRFMSEARAITNLIGNGIATLVISKWDKEFDEEKGKTISR